MTSKTTNKYSPKVRSRALQLVGVWVQSPQTYFR